MATLQDEVAALKDASKVRIPDIPSREAAERVRLSSKLGLHCHGDKIMMSKAIRTYLSLSDAPLETTKEKHTVEEWNRKVSGVQSEYGARHPNMTLSDWSSYLAIIARDSVKSQCKRRSSSARESSSKGKAVRKIDVVVKAVPAGSNITPSASTASSLAFLDEDSDDGFLAVLHGPRSGLSPLRDISGTQPSSVFPPILSSTSLTSSSKLPSPSVTHSVPRSHQYFPRSFHLHR